MLSPNMHHSLIPFTSAFMAKFHLCCEDVKSLSFSSSKCAWCYGDAGLKGDELGY